MGAASAVAAKVDALCHCQVLCRVWNLPLLYLYLFDLWLMLECVADCETLRECGPVCACVYLSYPYLRFIWTKKYVWRHYTAVYRVSATSKTLPTSLLLGTSKANTKSNQIGKYTFMPFFELERPCLINRAAQIVIWVRLLTKGKLNNAIPLRIRHVRRCPKR